MYKPQEDIVMAHDKNGNKDHKLVNYFAAPNNPAGDTSS